MDGGLFGGIAARHRTSPNLICTVPHIVVAIHRRFFGFWGAVMMGGYRAVIARAADAAGYGHSRENGGLECKD